MKNEIKRIVSSVSDEFCTFETKLKEIIDNYDEFLKDNLSDFVLNNAKFLRPATIFLVADVLNIKSDTVFDIALAVELIHNASLIHDDIIDEAYQRRNSKTIHTIYDTKTAVLAGDLLLASALKILSKTNPKIINIFSDKIFKTIQGEINQNKNFKKVTTVDEYLNKTFNKTANLFIAGIESLFTLADIKDDIKTAIKNYMINFCYAFQIQNDIKGIDSDFKLGNYTLPLIYYFEENREYNKNNLEKYILKTQNVVDDYKNRAIEAVKDLKIEKSTLPLVELIRII